MKHYISIINTFVNKNVNQFFLGCLFIGIFSWFCGFFNNIDVWTEIHQVFYLYLFFVSIIIVGRSKITPFEMLICLLLGVFPFTHDFLQIFSNWLFFDSAFKEVLKNVAAKDVGVLVAILMVGIISIGFIKLIFQYFNQRLSINLIFLNIVLISVLFITFVIHYGVINFGYKTAIKIEKEHMENIFKIKEEEVFLKACISQGYDCYINANKDDIKNKTQDSNFKLFLENIGYNNPNMILEGNFPIGNPNNVYVIRTHQNRWIIENHKVKELFVKAESVLMSLLVLAHGFWSLFFSWLIIFHNKKKNA